jgi:predicted MFS family arabinose efflux permease
MRSERPRTRGPERKSRVSDSQTMTESAPIPRWYWLAYLTGGFGLALNAMMSFLLPLRAAELDISIGLIGLMVGVKGATEALVSVQIGGLIDRIGPRTAFILGTAGCSGMILLYTQATSILVFMAFQVIVGMLRPLAWVGSQSFVSGLRSGADAATDTGRLSFIATGAQIVAPLLVGFSAQATSISSAFFVFSGYCAIFVLIGIALPRGSDSQSAVSKKRQGLLAGLSLFKRRRIRVVMLLSGARLWINNAWVSFFPLLLVTNGTKEGTASTVVSSMAVVGTVLSPMTGRFVKKFRVEFLCAFSLTAGATGVVLAPLLDSVPAAYLSAFLLGIGHGISLPTLLVMIGNAVPPEQRGLALGLRSSVNQAAAATAPPLVAGVIGLTAATIAFPLAGAIGFGLVVSAVFTTRGGDEVDHTAAAD